MANQDVMAVDERLSRLETTVATGFHEQGQRIERIEDRMSALENKVNVVGESIRADVKTVLEAVTAYRRLTRSILEDHSKRLRSRA